MKLCPSCDKEYEDSLVNCPDDDTPLVAAGRKNNPRLPGVRHVDSDAHTAMFTLEQMQLDRDMLNKAADEPEDPEDDKFRTAGTPQPEPQDPDSTRTITLGELEKKRAERDAARAAKEAGEAENPDEKVPDQTIKRVRAAGPTPEEQEKRRKVMMFVLVGLLVTLLLGGGITVWAVFLRKVSLEIVTTPPGAMVLVDGQELGNSPLMAHVPRGAHAVKARLDGYLEAAEVVDVKAASNIVLNLRRSVPDRPSAPADDPVRARAEQLYLDGKALLDKNRLDDAEGRFRAMAALVPDDARPMDALAEIARRRAAAASAQKKAGGRPGGGGGGGGEDGDDDADLRKIKPALRKKDALKYLDQARTAYDMGDMGRARELLTRCLRYDPSQVQCHRVLARVYTKEDNVPKVKYHLERYLELGGPDEDFKVRDWIRAH
ncbi:MAG: PEGA domain-containing protein [Deltaproteobacteria bacterium]|nr:PEGA domain-containing protein [Deltaproteobacteria bacterium]